MTIEPLHIEQTHIAATPLKGIHTLEHLLNAWLSLNQDCYINQIAFTQLCETHQLQKVNSYHDTRGKRFQHFIEEILLQPLLEKTPSPDQQKQLTIKLCQWLIRNCIPDLWLQTLHRRLLDKNHVIDKNVQHQLKITHDTQNTLKLSMQFQSTATNASKSHSLYQGESIFTFQILDNFEIQESLHCTADLFEPTMNEAFTTEPLDEQINIYITQIHQTSHEEEIEILRASRDYYLDKITDQELQQLFISTNIYSVAFKSSKGHELIKQIITKKPIKGFTL